MTKPIVFFFDGVRGVLDGRFVSWGGAHFQIEAASPLMLAAIWRAIPEAERRELTEAFAQGFAEVMQ